MLLKDTMITFLGAGSIAEAMIAGLVHHKVVEPQQIIATNVSNEERLQYLEQTYNIRTTHDRKSAVSIGHIIILAMKPMQIKEAIDYIRPSIHPKQLFVSVLAGISTSYLEQLISEKAYVIRAMPNTSAKVGASATAISKGTFTTDEHMAQAEKLFSSVGTVTTVEEKKLDAVTGLAGSGPAYFYFLIEAMQQAGMDAGLTHEEAHALVTQTVVGVGERLKTTSKTPQQLYEEVMSPQGTTEAGINVLREYETQAIIKSAVTKAVHRSKELGTAYE